MTKTVRSARTAGIAVMTAATLAFVPSVAQPTPRPVAMPAAALRVASPAIELSASVQPLSTAALPSLLTNWLETIVVPPSASAPVPIPAVQQAAVGTSIDSFIKNTYNTVEPWVRYGFELATYAVGWVPYVGWLAPQIMIFYNLGERIVRSITFNTADFLGGQVSFGQGLRNVGRDTVNSFIYFANDELNFFLPGFPPLPPIGNTLTALTTAKVAAPALVADVTVPAEADNTEIDTPKPTTTPAPFRGGRLAHFFQRATHTNTADASTSLAPTSSEDQGVVEQPKDLPRSTDQARPRPHGLVGGLSSAIRHLVSSATHPLRDHAVPSLKKEPAAAAG